MTNEDMSQNALLRSHALRVMATVEKALARIDEPEKLDEMLHTLGRRHSAYSVRSDFIDVSRVRETVNFRSKYCIGIGIGGTGAPDNFQGGDSYVCALPQ